jgi:hypothetical protein
MNNKLLRLKFDFNPNSSDSMHAMLPHGHRILAFGPDKQEVIHNGPLHHMIDPYIDVILDTAAPHTQWAQRRFIVLPIGAEGLDRNLVNNRKLLGSFVAANGKQCYVFEGGMVGV